MHTIKNGSDEFIIEYDYYGLSGTAWVRSIKSGNITYFNCCIKESGEKIYITYKKEIISSFWVDRDLGIPTALAEFLGHAIENKIGVL